MNRLLGIIQTQDVLVVTALNRLTHYVQIIEMNGESYGLKRSKGTVAYQAPGDPDEE